MSEEAAGVLPYEIAQKIVGNVIEEEHLHDPDRRILTVYDKKGKELCWFDAEDILAEVNIASKKAEDIKIAAVEHILRSLPEWVLEIAGQDE